MNGIRPYGIIVGEDSKHSFVKYSRYWEKVWTIPDNNMIGAILEENFVGESEKPVIIPWSDGAEAFLDTHYDALSRLFILPSINKNQGAICKLMNKDKQTNFANKLGMKMLSTRIVPLNIDLDIDTIVYPVILKPVASVEGRKKDIKICYNRNEYNNAIQVFQKLGYNRVLEQQYLEKREELLLTGAIGDKMVSFTIVKHIRQWPIGFGDGSFSEIVDSVNDNHFFLEVMNKLKLFGYRGTIDIEFFKADDRIIYLNEINWRSSGRNFICLWTGVHSAYYYYLDQANKNTPSIVINHKFGYTMNEATDVRYVVYEGLSLKIWLVDRKKTDSFALWYYKDIIPVVFRYALLAIEMMRRLIIRGQKSE